MSNYLRKEIEQLLSEVEELGTVRLEAAKRTVPALINIEHLTEICETANLPCITLNTAEVRAVLLYVEWLQTERTETLDTLAALKSGALVTTETGTDARGQDVAIIVRGEHKRLKDCEESLNHLLHLHHGISIGGPEFSPPSTSEWNAALSRARSVLDGTS